MAMSGGEAFTITNQTSAAVAGMASFPLKGGHYLWNVVATFGSQSFVALQILGADGTTYMSVRDPTNTAASLTATGADFVAIPPGIYNFTCGGTISAISVNITRIPD